MCAGGNGPTITFSLSTSGSYASVATLPSVRAQGNKVVLGVLVISMTSAATLTVELEVSYDEGKSWTAFGSPANSTAVGPFNVAGAGLDASFLRAKVSLSGTSQFAMGTVTFNQSCQ